MRIKVMTGGGQGDVQPLVLLAERLHASGHDVTVCGHPSDQRMIGRRGVGFAPLGTNNANATQVAEDVHRQNPKRSRFRTLGRMLKAAQPNAETLSAYFEASSNADLIVYSAISAYAYHVAEARNVSSCGVSYFPVAPTQSFPSPIFPVPIELGSLFNLATYHGMDQLFWQPNRIWINKWRRDQLGLRALPFTGAHSNKYAREKSLSLVAVSSRVVPPPADWPNSVKMTGFFLPDLPASYEPPHELVRFLERYPKSICLSLGGTADTHANDLQRMLLSSARRLNRGLVVIRGLARYTSIDADDVCYADARYAWIYPRVGIVVHHIGTGTMSEAIRAGVPSVPIPFFGEQRFWGHRVHELGVGTTPIPRREVTEEKLFAALSDGLQDVGLAKRASKLASEISTEDGLGRAVELMERHAITTK